MYAEVGIETAVILPSVNPECAFLTQSVQEAVAGGKITSTVFEKIARGNAARLLGIAPR